MLERDWRTTVGTGYDDLRRRAESCDVLLNVSGMLTDGELRDAAPVRVWLDLDPAFNQLWHAVEGIDMRLRRPHRFATVGQAIGTPRLPGADLRPATGSRRCRRSCSRTGRVATRSPTTRSPRSATGAATARSITAASLYGQKVHSFRELYELPRRVTASASGPALAIHPDETEDLAELERHGWELAGPAPRWPARPTTTRAFVRGSRAELGIAKSGYVVSRCGLVQRSQRVLPGVGPAGRRAGDRLLALPSGGRRAALVRDRRRGGRRRRGDPRRLRAPPAAARALAEEWLDSRRVLPRLLDAVGAPA